MSGAIDRGFWAGRRVLLTGHTGFKGAWLSLVLAELGAKVAGYALAPPTPSLHGLARLDTVVDGIVGDVCDAEGLRSCVARADPDIVFHFAAEALVRRAHRQPARCFAVNVMGTVNLLEAVAAEARPSVVMVSTSDKVYRNENLGAAFDETAPLGGEDPYSASKVGQEMVVRAYGHGALARRGIRAAAVRAGNVIGGGDFGEDRLIPDLYRAYAGAGCASIRHPEATRPWQHVLDCLSGYLLYVQALHAQDETPRTLNIGPAGPPLSVGAVADAMASNLGVTGLWRTDGQGGPPEAARLAIDASLAARLLGWTPRFSAEEAVRDAAAWYRRLAAGEDIRSVSKAAVARYLEAAA